MPPPELPPIPADAVEERFLAATGPGGQNVNKVATAVQLRVHVFRLGLTPFAWARLRVLAGTRLSGEGVLTLTARRFRTQDANRQDARRRLDELLAAAHHRPERRIATKPSRAAKQKRVEGKAVRGAVKRGRARPQVD